MITLWFPQKNRGTFWLDDKPLTSDEWFCPLELLLNGFDRNMKTIINITGENERKSVYLKAMSWIIVERVWQIEKGWPVVGQEFESNPFEHKSNALHQGQIRNAHPAEYMRNICMFARFAFRWQEPQLCSPWVQLLTATDVCWDKQVVVWCPFTQQHPISCGEWIEERVWLWHHTATVH
jgi:hypothetical protein